MVKGLFLIVVAAGLALGGARNAPALTIFDYQPVPSHEREANKNDQQFNVPAQAAPQFVRSSFVSPHESSAPCRLLNKYMERLIYVYHRLGGVQKQKKLAALNLEYRNILGSALPPVLRDGLEEYEKMCECIHDMGRSGFSLQDIYVRRLCGRVTTKEKRLEIINKCENCSKVASQ
jgi:hypothetical protein